ncbi:MAG: pilus assembly protein TadG-related protein [Henriciella sp.]|uniref:TadE/TadG family type IV pilus assembly protein n=1 Tax=Henriciella sp. TaxID=1968823 RepID=UPI003C739444
MVLLRRRRVPGLCRDEGAHVLVMVSLLAPVFVMMAALAVDTGAISNQKQEIQGLADIAAIAAAADIKNAEPTVYGVLSDNNFFSRGSDDLSSDER